MMANVAVLGGGISGLSAAYYLSKFNNGNINKILVLEASKRVGGWIKSESQDTGTCFEIGPRSLRTVGIQGANTIALANALGLEKQIISVPHGHPATRNRLVCVGGELHKLPSSLSSIFRKTAPLSRPLIMTLIKEYFTPKVTTTDESLYSFVNRRFGNDVAEYLIDPLTRGVFAGNARSLSVKCLTNNLHDWEQQHGGVLRGVIANLFKQSANLLPDDEAVLSNPLVKKAKSEKWAAWSLAGGLETLVHALEREVISRGVEIQKGIVVDELILGTVHKGITLRHGNSKVNFDHVVSCLPANNLSRLMAPISNEAQELLSSIPYVTVGVVNFEFSQSDLLKEQSFGYLVPSSEPNKVLGAIFDTCSYPQNNKTVITVMLGGYWFESIFGKDPSPDVILAAAREEIRNVLGIHEEPIMEKASILVDCIPQYVVGHVQSIKSLRELIVREALPLTVTGSAYDGVGINDTIMSAKRAIQAMTL